MNIIKIIYHNILAPKLNQRVMLMKAISLLVHTKMYITTLYSTFMPVSSSWKAMLLPTLGAYNAIEFAGYRYRPVAYPTGSAPQRFFVQHAVVI